ncbi:hypothetical protein HMPREF1536_00348 [Parabacteroides gordonii MS-1 = DSM 23371]|jgi:hypothetical protein|uniref:Uncharacterized protein n=1 Tax=Parabacteroides gordonii MS-1 = DSM 23371 TaxID=1203610 RepID=A0A0F5JRP1_9BACT|nr:hypothetical protein HMPREF1536_00348 [Parabacteroides gordonii MS-1 = DSM 23371]
MDVMISDQVHEVIMDFYVYVHDACHSYLYTE